MAVLRFPDYAQTSHCAIIIACLNHWLARTVRMCLEIFDHPQQVLAKFSVFLRL